ncbi:glycosyltransferase family 4 protein [Thermotoga profunda]|uniref:glycosyltransferase family 4 protein n=1 Tax=Thermotoga profunda TaxID=1508420 RepID=UPI0005973585|nr:MraY family glycosyltransferase [Thermotoga profunda]
MITQVIVSFLISLVATPFVMIIAKKFKIVDRPDGMLKTHQRIIPYLGGLAIYAGVAPFVLEMKLFILASIMFILGLLDDIKPVKWYVRLIIELIIGWFMSLIFTQNFFMSVFYTLVFVLVINATNMIDGMDGVCATVVIIGMIFSANSSLQWALVGSLIGYLVYNFPPAKIFMGDAGSYFIGSIVSYTIFSNLKASFNLNVFFPFWILILDIFSGIVRRIIAQRSPFKGDRDHIYDKIWRRIGGSKVLKDRKTVIIMAVISITFTLLKYVGLSALMVFAGSIMVVLFLRMFWYDEGGNKYE